MGTQAVSSTKALKTKMLGKQRNKLHKNKNLYSFFKCICCVCVREGWGEEHHGAHVDNFQGSVLSFYHGSQDQTQAVRLV